MDKKAIELSVNFLVVLILSIIMLGLGIRLITQFLGTAEEIRMELDVRTEEELSNMLNSGQLVAVAFNRQSINPGESRIFGLGILNVQQASNFDISITVTKAYDTGKNPIQTSEFISCTDCIRYEHTKIINTDSSEKIPVLISVPKQGVPKGDYIIDVVVTSDGQPYGLTKIYVVV